MGILLSAERKQSRIIDERLIEDSEKEKSTFKLLLLGPAYCGKSTVLKQMKILHTNGFSDEEIQRQKYAIIQDILMRMTEILAKMTNDAVSFLELEREIDATVVVKAYQSFRDGQLDISFELSAALKNLWNDTGVQKGYKLAVEQNIVPDSIKYFFDNIDRVMTTNYIPTEQDVLRCRIATTGIVEIKFSVQNRNCRMFDVGGQRSERRKWIHCFDNVQALFFIASLSDYDMVLMEDNVTNRMQEALKLFDQLSISVYFENASMILFLNKTDVFAEKIKVRPLKIAFPDFEGPQTYECCLEFITNKFEGNRIAKKIYTHPTCATDTENVKFIMSSCLDIIFANCLRKTGLM